MPASTCSHFYNEETFFSHALSNFVYLQVKTTHYIRGTTSPHWEVRTEFLIQDYTQASLSFVIYSWNISKMSDTDMLGLAMLSLSQVFIFLQFALISYQHLFQVAQFGNSTKFHKEMMIVKFANFPSFEFWKYFSHFLLTFYEISK